MTVAWDSQTTTTQPASLLRPAGTSEEALAEDLERIAALEVEAAQAGDRTQVAICRVARGLHVAPGDVDDLQFDYIDHLSQAAAIAECRRVIADARAMAD